MFSITSGISASLLDDFIPQLEKAGKYAFQSCAPIFIGYDDISEEIYEIPPIRDWVSLVINKYPHIIYFLTGLENLNLLFLAGAADVKMLKIANSPMVQMTLSLSNEIKNRITTQLKHFEDKIKDPQGIKTIINLIKNL